MAEVLENMYRLLNSRGKLWRSIYNKKKLEVWYHMLGAHVGGLPLFFCVCVCVCVFLSGFRRSLRYETHISRVDIYHKMFLLWNFYFLRRKDIYTYIYIYMYTYFSSKEHRLASTQGLINSAV